MVDEVRLERRPRTLTNRVVWWRELALIVAFYAVYMEARDLHGDNLSAAQYNRALNDARQVMSLETVLHLHWEHGAQVMALHAMWLIRSANIFYGSAHFLVTLGVLLWLYHRAPDRYRTWRTALGVATAVALVGFIVFPVVPPRMLPPEYGFNDTLHSFGGLWSFNSGVVEHISDPFAAMPSLHLCWATWCAVVIAPGARRRWSRWLAISYPLITAVVVIVTGNHYLLDLVGGVGCLLIGMAVATGVESVRRRRHRGRARLDEPAEPPISEPALV